MVGKLAYHKTHAWVIGRSFGNREPIGMGLSAHLEIKPRTVKRRLGQQSPWFNARITTIQAPLLEPTQAVEGKGNTKHWEMVCCAAPKCSKRGDRRQKKRTFRFPKDRNRCKEWVLSISRVGPDGVTLWTPTSGSRLCEVRVAIFPDNFIHNSWKTVKCFLKTCVFIHLTNVKKQHYYYDYCPRVLICEVLLSGKGWSTHSTVDTRYEKR